MDLHESVAEETALLGRSGFVPIFHLLGHALEESLEESELLVESLHGVLWHFAEQPLAVFEPCLGIGLTRFGLIIHETFLHECTACGTR